MKLLLDANISRRLTPVLAEHFGECVHVNTVVLPMPATDTEIWDYARQHGYIIVTQDSDFLNFLQTKGYPPKVVLLKTGNMDRTSMQTLLINLKPFIEDLDKNAYGLLEIARGKYA
jgi:predicted nuclease of predicted toxin-antitoxin system